MAKKEKAEAVEALQDDLCTYFDKLENSTANQDKIFKLVATALKTSELRFGLYDILDRSKYIKPIEHTVQLNLAENSLVVNAESSFMLSKKQIDGLLLEKGDGDENALQTFIEILNVCMHENLMWMFFNRRYAGTAKASVAAAPIIAEVLASAKLALLYSYKHLKKRRATGA